MTLGSEFLLDPSHWPWQASSYLLNSKCGFLYAWHVLKFGLFLLGARGAGDEGNKPLRQASWEDGRARSWVALRAGHTGWGGGWHPGEGTPLDQVGNVVSELRCPVVVQSLSHT